jgi:aspartyl aminopeptidase
VQPTARQRKSAAAGPVKKAKRVSGATWDQILATRLAARAIDTGVCRFACFSARNICSDRLRIDSNATARRDNL